MEFCGRDGVAATINGPNGSYTMSDKTKTSVQSIARDWKSPSDLNVNGKFENGELTEVRMNVSANPKTGTNDEIVFTKDGTLTVNGQPAQLPMTTENGTKISGSAGGKIIIDTLNGDHFEMERTICPAINLEGSISPDRGVGNVGSDIMGDFDDTGKAFIPARDGNLFGNGVGGGAGGAGTVAGPTFSPLLMDLLDEIRKTLMAVGKQPEGAPIPASVAGFLARAKTPEFGAAIEAKGRAGGISLDKLLAYISDPTEKDKVAKALADPSVSLENIVGMISKPAERKAFMGELVGPERADEMLKRIGS